MDNIVTINIISNIRIKSNYIYSYINQLLSLKQESFTIGKIIFVCDDLLSTSLVNEWAAKDSRVILIQEEFADISLKSMHSKSVQWASLCNQGILESLKYHSNFTLFIESDLTFPYDLLEELVNCKLDICAPIIFLGSSFYDSWGFRDLEGNRIYSFQNLDVNSNPIELSSVGSCVLFNTEIFKKGVLFRGSYDTGLLVGVCNDARRLGYKVWMLPQLSILHPTSVWRKQIWHISEIISIHSLYQFKIACRIIVPAPYDEFIRKELLNFLAPFNVFNLSNFTFDFTSNYQDKLLSITIKDV
jgi:hypothetical protein